MYEEEKRYIQEVLDGDDKLCAIAEEASELVQAVMKVRRACGFSDNATPVPINDALDNYKEEIVDLLICLMADDWNIESLVKEAEESPKWERWAKRIEEAQNE